MPPIHKAPDKIRSVVTTIAITRQTSDIITELAWKNRMSRNELINKILENYIENNKD